MVHVMNPTGRLLNSDVSPLGLVEQVVFGQEFSELFGQNHMSKREISSYRTHGKESADNCLPVFVQVVGIPIRIGDS
jgi:hypothetical protein